MIRILSRLAILVLVLVLILPFANPIPVQATPAANASLTTGSPGSGVTITGSGFTAAESVSVAWDTVTMASTTVPASGAWTAQFTIPASASGSHTITVTGSGGSVINISFQVTAAVTVSPTQGTAGTTVTVTGAGFGNAETGITITYDATVVSSSAVASNVGAWTATFAVPASASGTHVIRASGSTTSVGRDVIFTSTPSVSINRTGGAPGSSLTVTASGFSVSETGITVTFDGTPVTAGVTANSQGSWTTNIVIPPSTSGAHLLHAYGAVTPASATSDLTFIVGAGISISQTTGPPGTAVVATGSGFGASETGINVTFDSTSVASGISASARGGWTATFNAPNSASGSHAVRAAGSTTTTAAEASFAVTPTVSMTNPTGAPGSTATVTGAGFAANERGITITWDGTSAGGTGINANAQGSWTGTFTVPNSPAGIHTVHANGPTTQAASTPDVSFTVSAGTTVNQASAMPGSTITVAGSGFAPNEQGITVTYDGAQVASNIRANAQGAWTAPVTVPNSASGPHIIHAYGAVTPTTTTPDVTFSITPTISIPANQASGAPGNSITVTGAGFGANETGISVMYDDASVATAIRANAQGSWTTTFVVPPSVSGSHSITAKGAVTQPASVAAVAFSSAATVTLNPTAGSVGGTLGISGSGFASNSAIKISYDDKDIPAEGATTDPSGSFTKSITVPVSKGGNHTILVKDALTNQAKATFAMDSAPPPVPNLTSPEDGGRAGLVGGATPTLVWSAVQDPSGVTYTLDVDGSSDFTEPILQKTDLKTNRYTLTASEALPLGQYYWRVRATDGASNQSAWSQPRVLKSGMMSTGTLIMLILLVIAAAAAAYFILVRRPMLRRKPAGAAQAPEPVITVTGEWRQIESPDTPRERDRDRPLPLRLALPEPKKGAKTLSIEDQARLRVVADFAQSLPLVQPGYDVSWLMQLVEAGTGVGASAIVYEQLLKGDIQVRYEPAWMHHPIYQDLMSILEGQPTLQELNSFIDAVNRCSAEVVSLLQDIYRDTLPDYPTGLLQKGGWAFISGIYADAMSWFLGKSLRDPSDRDYSIKPGRAGDSGLWLHGEDSTAFPGPLVQLSDENEGIKFRDLHLRLRRNYRNAADAKGVASMTTQLEVQRSKLLNVFSQFGRLKQ